MTLKSAIEDLFGSNSWYALKETNDLGTWKKYAQKTLRAVELSIRDTVQVYDDKWLEDITDTISRGLDAIKKADSIDETVGAIAGTMVEVSFLQIGNMPRRKGNHKTTALRKGEWKLDSFRSVVYLQTKEQEQNLFLSMQRRRIGFEAQLELEQKYRKSGSEMSYPEWCRQQEQGNGAA